MKILAIESSCDETGACVVEKKDNQVKVLSNVIATSSDMHAITGGIIPENAAREQVKSIIPVIVHALIQSRNLGDTGGRREGRPVRQSSSDGGTPTNIKWVQANEILTNDIDAIAVTYGPGLIGSLLIGVETAKTLSFTLNKPIIPVNHLLAHIYANFIFTNHQSLITNPFPFIGLIVSGGHTDLLYFKSHDDYKWLGGTRDDAAGEALDKIGRMLNLNYPAGPEIEKRANIFKLKTKNVKPQIKFQSPMISSKDFDFSFSGLKAEVMRYVKKQSMTGGSKWGTPSEHPQAKLRMSDGGTQRQDPSENMKNQICYAVQKAIFDVLVKKTLKAAEVYKCKTILLGGGVSANQSLIEQFKLKAKSSKLQAEIFSPEKIYATDNAAMIGAYALIAGKTKVWEEIKSNPELYFT